MSFEREIRINRGNRVAAWLTLTRQQTIIRHDPGCPEGISLHLPFQVEPRTYPGGDLPPFLANLLPEGKRLDVLIRQTKTSRDHVANLLLAVGEDTIGDVYLPKGEPARAARLETAVSEGFENVFELDIKLNEPASIPGVQRKVSATRATLLLQSHHGQGILKLGDPDKRFLVENEHFFMRMAASLGLSVAATEIVTDQRGTAGLWVQRFDRLAEGTRLHVEDGCQLLDLYASQKYEVSVEELGSAVVQHSTVGLPDALRFVELTAFSWLIANGDFHAKNVSILLTPKGEWTLAPAYDLLSTWPYGDRTAALSLRGKTEDWSRDDLCSLGESLGIPKKAVERKLNQLLVRSEPWLDRLAETKLPTRLLNPLRKEIQLRHKSLAKP